MAGSKDSWKSVRSPVGAITLALMLGAACAVPAQAGDAGTGYVLPDGQGGGEADLCPAQPELTEKQRKAIQAEIEENVRWLRAEGKLAEEPLAAPVRFGWPLRPANNLTSPGYHHLAYYVDQNPACPNQLSDYQCGTRTYDRADGYNHMGTDFSNWPFTWYKMDNNQVEVVAVAPGVIVNKSDGNFDRSCSWSGSNWNAVYVQHADGSVAWYGHLKAYSLTPKGVGDRVERGERLGVVGSSGNSMGPHLHLEIRDAANRLIDPWAGPCNSLNADSWWLDQRPYYDSAINQLTTGPMVASFPSCPTQETPNEQTRFLPGATIFFTGYYRHELITQQSIYRIRRPDGSVYSQWSHYSDAPHYSASWWFWYFTNFAPSGPTGLWRLEVNYEGKTYVRTFNIGGTPVGRVRGDYPAEALLTVAEAAGGQITLSWPPSCLTDDTDYEIYEGAIGDFRSHTPRTCSTGGALTQTLTPAVGSAYYLVVPRKASREGSYGYDSAGNERPASTAACLAQEIGACK